ncbi:MAG: efflux system, rane fusion protein CmeA [Rickettsiales bacterium]|jgi:multidrug efflux system membrane fusion protein|nr:efflux system, rane fusion protein CmeA [Rickettsiales bacterium]
MPQWTNRNKISNRTKIIAAIIVVAMGSFSYKRFIAGGSGVPQGMGGGAPVSVAEVIEREVQIWSEFSGRLVAVDEVEVRPQVSGLIESIRFKNGAMVRKDELLLTIDPRQYAAEFNRAEGALASAKAQVSLAKTELARAKRLSKDQAIPQREYDERKNAYNVAEANLKSAEASLDAARLNLNYTKVKAPIAGKVGRAEITAGNLVEAGPNAPILTTVVGNDPIYVDFEVDENTFLQYAGAGNDTQIPVVMSLNGKNDLALSGHVESFDNHLNTTSGTIRARAVFDNKDGSLIPGLFVRVKLGTATQAPAVLITERAVGTDQNKKFVFVLGEGNAATYREIVLGSVVDGGLRVVREGLKPGEKIVVNGLQRVHPGQPISPEMVSMDTGQPLNAAGSTSATISSEQLLEKAKEKK